MKIKGSRFSKKLIFLLTVIIVAAGSTLGTYTAPVSDVINNAEKGNSTAINTAKPKLPTAENVTDYTWSSPQTLKGIYSSAELFFSLPKYWDTRYVCVQLEYRVSQLIRGIPCTLTFYINKQPFYSCNISYKNDETDFIYILIPADLLKNDRENRSNTLLVSGYARLYNEQGCIDQESNANWITITEASGVEVGYNLKPYNNRLDYYPYPYMSSQDKTGKDTLITVADAARNEEVAAVLMIMSDLSRNTVGNNSLTVSSWGDTLTRKFSSRIIVALTKDMPSELIKYTDPYKNALKGQAMILSVNDHTNKPLLIITSDDADCLPEAGYFLTDSDRVSQEPSNVTFIRKGTAQIKMNVIKQSDIKADRYTLEEMTGGGFDFIGPFHQVKTLFLPIPGDYSLASAGKVTLYFRYSKNLDFKRSMLTVYWGDIPVGSKRLTLEKADGDELTFFMPADVVGTRAGSMKFAFDLEIPDLFCTTRREEMPWAYITKNSAIYLPPENSTRLSFASRPAPFLSNGSMNDILLIVSDKPSSVELTIAGRILALYTKSANGYGTLRVLKAGEFNEKDANYNIITSGTPADNSFISKINDKLYFQYSSDGSHFVTNDKLILTADYAKSIGTLQLLKSPYADGRAVLVLTGPDLNALKMVTRMISSEKLSWNLNNDFVLTDSEGNIKTYQFQNYELMQKKPSIAESVTDNKNSLLFALAGTSVMLVLFLAAVLIFIRIKKKQH